MRELIERLRNLIETKVNETGSEQAKRGIVDTR